MTLEVRLEGFSGPLDLLCHLVESREIEASSIKVSDIIARYAKFLIETERASINEVSEFLSLAARLLLGKIASLSPSQETGEEAEEDLDTGLNALEVLERYKPYRNAAAGFSMLQRERERCFTRKQTEQGSPWFDLGDLYSLSTQWWELIESRRSRPEKTRPEFEQIEWDGVPTALPDEAQVEMRMEEINNALSHEGSASLSDLLGSPCDRARLIVTFLALLEMTRLGMVKLVQREVLGDVSIIR